jgi:transmembrane sensor
MQDEERIAAEAARWQARMTGGAATEADRAAFAAWRAADLRHAAMAREFSALWHAASRGTLAAPRPSARRHLGRRVAIGGGLAAASLAGLAWLPRAIEDSWADLVTAIGERREVALGDTLRLTLNTDTALSVTPETIRLWRGEVFCALAADTPMMFATSGLLVRAAAGAAFNLAEVAGTEAVQVERGPVQAMTGSGGAWAGIPPGHRLRAAATAPERADPLDLLWRQGVLAFRQRRLDWVAAALDRYRRGRILIPSASLRARLVSGSLALDRPEDAVAALAGLFGLRLRRLPGGIVLIGEG